jgi:hypothetical protein
MEKISAETIKEILALKPDITVEDFIEILKSRWLEHINQAYNREISVVIKEYKDLVKKIISNATNS